LNRAVHVSLARRTVYTLSVLTIFRAGRETFRCSAA
jgi:hypothetical protein